MTTYLGNSVDPVVDYWSQLTKWLPTPPFHLRTECVVLEKQKFRFQKSNGRSLEDGNETNRSD